MAQMIAVDIIWTPNAGSEETVRLNVAGDTTVAGAVAASGLFVRQRAQASPVIRYGIWGKLVSADTALRNGDRVEIYRPLKVDPKLARISRAKKNDRDRQRD